MNSSKNMNPLGGKELQIRLGGAGGQGLQLCAALLTQAFAGQPPDEAAARREKRLALLADVLAD